MNPTPMQPLSSNLPAEVWQRISRLPGDEAAGVVGPAYTQAKRCEGLAILINPSVRSAVAVVLGIRDAGGGCARTYLVDVNCNNLSFLLRELAKEKLADEVTLYHGRPADFFRDLPLLPGFLCIDDATAASDLMTISRYAPAGVPIVVLTRAGSPAFAQDRRGYLQRGFLEVVQDAGEALLLRSTNPSPRMGIVPSTNARLMLQGRLHERYFLSGTQAPAGHTPVADLTEHIRQDFSRQFPTVSGYGHWPQVNPEPADLPANMPGDKPWPKISIVTPSFNQGRYIEETILSVLNQGYPSVEHIIIDGGSTDETLAVLEKYRNNVAYAVSEADNGQSHAINKGMALATGEILTWLNSDDRLAPGALAAVALAFETSGADMVAGICRLYRDGECVQQHLTSCADGPLPLDDLLDLDGCWNAGQFFFQPEVMFTREFWLRAGGHVNDWLHYSMDYELWLRFAEAGARLHVIGRPVAWFRLHEQQKTHGTEHFQAELIVVRDGFLNTRERSPAVNVKAEYRQTPLRVTFLNDHGAFFGAGIAHARLARAVARAGNTVTMVSIIDRPKYGMETPEYTVESLLDRIAATCPDLVVVGNLHNAAVEPLLLNYLSDRFPTIVTMHDFWMLTGRCAYTGACEKYLTGCDDTCPTATEYPAMDPAKIADAWKKKQLLLQAEKRPVLLSNSSWVETFTRDTMRLRSLDGTHGPAVERFRLSFPLDVFRPRDRRSCRDSFQLPQDAFIVLFPASLQDSRKGGRTFLEALSHLDAPNFLVVTIGLICADVQTPLKLLQLGHVTDPYRIAQLFSAADVAAVPSSAEAFGQVCVETIACGTPVVGYPVPGVREALRDGITGLMAADTNPASLAAVVHQLYSRPDLRRDLSRWGRIYVENEWSEFSAYRQLFLAWRATGMAARLNLGRGIQFLPANPVVPAVTSVWKSKSSWVPGRGISWQAKSVAPGPDAFWYVCGPSATAEIFAETSGPHYILISYRPREPLQLKVRCNGVVLGTFSLPSGADDTGRMIELNARLEAGGNVLHFELSGSTLALTDICVEPAATSKRDELYGDSSPEHVLSSVWGHLER